MRSLAATPAPARRRRVRRAAELLVTALAVVAIIDFLRPHLATHQHSYRKTGGLAVHFAELQSALTGAALADRPPLTPSELDEARRLVRLAPQLGGASLRIRQIPAPGSHHRISGATVVVADTASYADDKALWNLWLAPRRHAVAYADGTAGYLTEQEFQRLDLTEFVPLSVWLPPVEE